MTRIHDLAQQIEHIHHGDPWYGDPIATMLKGVTAGQAAAYPIPHAHSIWELVLHMTGWVREVRRRLSTGIWQVPQSGDWPAVPEPSAANWRSAVAALAAAHQELQQAVAALPETRLDQPLGGVRDRALGSGVTYGDMLHGILQHDAYHLGQIGILKKVL